jgi:hypothetical protein
MASACSLCASGAKRIGGRHVRESLERGVEDLGACKAPQEEPAPPRKPGQTFAERFARWCESAQAMGKPVQSPPPLLSKHWAEGHREPGDANGDDEATEGA